MPVRNVEMYCKTHKLRFVTSADTASQKNTVLRCPHCVRNKKSGKGTPMATVRLERKAERLRAANEAAAAELERQRRVEREITESRA